MLYHALLGPVVVSDANGEYMGYDGQVHTTADGRAQYGVFSGLGYLSERMSVAGHDRAERSRRHGAIAAGGLPAGRRVPALGRDDGRQRSDDGRSGGADDCRFLRLRRDQLRRPGRVGRLGSGRHGSVGQGAANARRNERDALADYLETGLRAGTSERRRMATFP